MTGQQGGGAPGQPGGNSPQDQESTQVGMPVPPATPAYTQQPPQQPQQAPPYGQAPGYPPPPPGYGGQPPAYGGPPPGGYPPAGYGQTPPPKRGGPSMLVVGAIALALVLVLGVGGMYAFGLGPFKPSASPTAAAQATSTPKPTKTPSTTPTEAASSPTASPAPETTAPASAPATTAPPTAAATTPGFSFTLPSFSFTPPSIGPSPSMTDADTALLQHVPEAIRDSCTPGAVVTPATASLNCNLGLDQLIFVYYTSYPDLASMNTAYQSYVLAYGSGAGSETCEIAANWPAESAYTIDKVHAGRLLCSSFGESPSMFWTDERMNIFSWSFGLGEVSQDDMWSFWANDAGPNL